MNEIIEALNKVISKPEDLSLLRTKLAGRVRYGYFIHDESVAARIDEDDNETFGHLDGAGEFVPLSEEEAAAFKAKFRWHFTEIFDKKNESNVLQFPARKLHSV